MFDTTAATGGINVAVYSNGATAVGSVSNCATASQTAAPSPLGAYKTTSGMYCVEGIKLRYCSNMAAQNI